MYSVMDVPARSAAVFSNLNDESSVRESNIWEAVIAGNTTSLPTKSKMARTALETDSTRLHLRDIAFIWSKRSRLCGISCTLHSDVCYLATATSLLLNKLQTGGRWLPTFLSGQTKHPVFSFWLTLSKLSRRHVLRSASKMATGGNASLTHRSHRSLTKRDVQGGWGSLLARMQRTSDRQRSELYIALLTVDRAVSLIDSHTDWLVSASRDASVCLGQLSQ